MLDLKLFLSAVLLHLACMGTCFGAFIKSTTVPPVDRADDNKRSQKIRHHRHNAPERDFWSSSSNDVVAKNSRSSQRSLSSISTTNQTNDINGNSPFVNHGLLLWNEQRKEWTGNRTGSRSLQPREAVIRPNTTYDDLLGSGRPFVKPISLSEMITFLVGVWEKEGLYG